MATKNKPSKLKRTQVFYGDPGAEQAFKTIDKLKENIVAALMDPESPIHKTISKADLPRILERLFKHYEFRAQLDWSKEQYYEVGSGTSTAGMPSFMIGVQGGEVAQFE